MKDAEREARVGASDKSAIQSAVERVKDAARGEDLQAIRQAVSDRQAAAALAQFVHGGGPGGPQADPGGAGRGGAGGGKEDLIDAEFEVKK
jgi:molecular chaperone DnaK